MPKIVLPVDGSPPAQGAVAQVLDLSRSGAIDVHLLKVQNPIDGHARPFVSQADLEAYHRGTGLTLVKPASASAQGAPSKPLSTDF